MATSPYFNFFENTSEQSLVQDLLSEAIKIYGHDILYLRRLVINEDILLGEDPASKFEEYFEIEAYVKSVDGFTGDGDILSRAGLFIKDEVTFQIARSTWEMLPGAPNRPFEGDVIYFPMVKKLFKIKFVEHEDIFYQTGALQSYDLICERWDYASERVDTANTELNTLLDEVSLDFLLDGNDNEEPFDPQTFRAEDVEPQANNEFFRIDTEDALDDSESSPFV